MFNQNEQFITRMKLRELHNQRDAMRRVYETLESNGTENPVERLRYLYVGLTQIEFSGERLHPDIVNLDVVLAEHAVQPELVQHWLQSLETELEMGKLRAEYLFIFGALLEEWASQQQDEEQIDTRQQETSQLVDNLSISHPERDYSPFLAPLLEGLSKVDKLDPSLSETLRSPVEVYDVETALYSITQDPYQPASLRQEANYFLNDKVLLREFRDAISIMLQNLDDWHWDGEGLETNVVWMRTRWRLLMKPDLPAATMLNVLSRRCMWHMGLYGSIQRLLRLHQLNQYSISVVVNVNNERRQWEEQAALKVVLNDIWSGQRVDTDNTDKLLEFLGTNDNIFVRHLQLVNGLRERAGSYDYQGGLDETIRILNAELHLTRRAMPDTPLYVIKTDLKDFYPNVPHALIRAILTGLKVAEADISFFERYIKVPLKRDEGVVSMKRGLPINNALSHVIGELILQLLDIHVMRSANVHIIRQLDDISILAPTAQDASKAWQALREFCDACDLALNIDKSGVVGIGGEVPQGLPADLPRWGLLELTSDLQWRIAEDAFADHLERTQNRISAVSTIIQQIERYNEGTKYVRTTSGIGLPLGEAHWKNVSQKIPQFHNRLFGDGIAGHIRKLIREHFDTDMDIPEACLYWAITAGGLGLRQPLVDLAMCNPEDWKPPIPPDTVDKNWSREQRAWLAYFNGWMYDIPIQLPDSTNRVGQLVDDFLKRGKELSGGEQQSLSDYWKWIIVTYGPQILERFGTFRFLLTRLVPVLLIVQKRMDE